jgi:hypothetical protein
MRSLWAIASIAILLIGPVSAQELVGCDKFKWPVEREMTALRAAHLQQVNSSTKLSAVPFVGTVMLVPSNTANLPKGPERTPKDDTFSGYLVIMGIASGTYSISVSDVAWLDVVEDDHFLKAKAHSGVQGCQGIRKVLQFELRGDPLIVQISGAPTPRLNVAILPAE